MGKRRPELKDINYIKKELEPIIKQIGYFPSHRQLKKLNRYDLVYALNNYRGKINAVREKMGQKFLRNTITNPRKARTSRNTIADNYLQNWGNFTKELEPIIKQIGYFPTKNELYRLGRSDLVYAMEKYHGRTKKVTKDMGYKIYRGKNRYLANWGNFTKELEPIIKQIGYFPTKNELYRLGRSDLVWAIKKHYGEVNAVRKKIGQNIIRNSPGVYNDKSNDQLINYVIENRNGKSISEVYKEKGLYNVLYKRGLIDELVERGILVRKRKINNFYDKKSDEELIDLVAKSYYGKNITKLARGNNRLYNAILKRNILQEILEKRILVRKGYGCKGINGGFLSLIKKDQTARNLAGAAIVSDEYSYEIEEIINELYKGKFKDQRQLHELLQKNKDEVLKLIKEGFTNLGAYLGEFSIKEKRIFPILLEQSFEAIPQTLISSSIEDKIFGMLKYEYNPRFNENYQETMEEIKGKMTDSKGKVKEFYEKLNDYYQGILKLGKRLEGMLD